MSWSDIILLMLPDSTPTIRYKDITPEDIANFARRNGYGYIRAMTNTDNDDASIYMNPRTYPLKHNVVRMNVEGYDCEHYTVEYSPISISQDESHPAAELVSGARFYVQVFSVQLPFIVESLYVESRTNLTLNNMMGWSSIAFLKGETVQLEGDFNDFFRVHTPLKDQEMTAFTILAPNVMLRMLQDAGNYDFEFSGNKVYFYKTFAVMGEKYAPLSKSDFAQLQAFGVDSARAMVRAGRPAKLVETDEYVPMWTLYGTSARKLTWSLALIFTFGIFLMIAFVVPILLIGLLFIGILGWLKIHRLKDKLRRYTADNSKTPLGMLTDSSMIDI